MSVRITVHDEFLRQFKQMRKKYRSLTSDYRNFLTELSENPLQGANVGNGLHKVRMAIQSKGKGKSGGARVITYIVKKIGEDYTICLLTIYDKSEISSVSDSYIKKIVNSIISK